MERLFDILDLSLYEGIEDLPLSLKVVIEGSRLDVDSACDVANGRGGITLLAEE